MDFINMIEHSRSECVISGRSRNIGRGFPLVVDQSKMQIVGHSP